jgi:hypothetical protein
MIAASACGQAPIQVPTGGVADALATEASTVVSGAADNARATVSAAVGTAAADVLSSGDLGALLRSTSQTLAGLNFTRVQTPADAPPESVSSLTLQATDISGSFTRLGGSGCQAAVTAALTTVGGVYPHASITMTVLNTDGSAIASGTKLPGKHPVVSACPADGPGAPSGA